MVTSMWSSNRSQQGHVLLWFNIMMIFQIWFTDTNVFSESLILSFLSYWQWKMSKLNLRRVHRQIQFVLMLLSLGITCYYVFFPISLRFCVQHCFLERSLCQRGCGFFWTLTAGRRPLEASWGAHTSCQQREPCFSPHTASFSKASPMILWVNTEPQQH